LKSAVREATRLPNRGRAAVPGDGQGVRPRPAAGRAGGSAGVRRGRVAGRYPPAPLAAGPAAPRRSSRAAGDDRRLAETGRTGYGVHWQVSGTSEGPPMPKYQCPECEAVLRRAEAIAPGKKIKCPKCEAVFPAKALPEDEPAPAAAEGAQTYGVAGAKAEAPPKPPLDDDENSDPYRVIRETGQDNKPEIYLGSLRDRFAKSKIGPAMYKTVIPSNWLLRLGLFTCIVAVIYFIVALFPIIFCEATPLRPFIRPRVNLMIHATFMFVFGGIMCTGAARMHDLTSYTWSI